MCNDFTKHDRSQRFQFVLVSSGYFGAQSLLLITVKKNWSAISDLTGTIANPLKVIEHVSRVIDAAQVADTRRAKSS